jgi:hypothetical protein
MCDIPLQGYKYRHTDLNYFLIVEAYDPFTDEITFSRADGNDPDWRGRYSNSDPKLQLYDRCED